MSCEVPEGWLEIPLSDCLEDFRNGWTYDTRALDGTVPMTRIETISSGQIDYDRIGFAQPDERIEAFKLRRNDILFSHINSVEHIAKVAIKKDERALYHGMNLMRLRPNAQVVPHFLFARLQSDETRDHFRATCKRAVNQASLNKGEIGSYRFLFPPIDEQHRIAEVLRSVDEVIARTQAVYDAAVATQHAAFATFLSSGDRSNESHVIAGWTTGRIDRVERLPKGWQIVKLVEVARLESGHTPDRKKPQYWDGGDVGWISLHDTQNLEKTDIAETEMRITRAGLANSSARLLPAGTVCFSRTATVGKCVIMARSMATSQDFANFVCSENLNNRYLLHLMRWMQPVWKSLASGSTHQTIYMPTFKALQIVLPTLVDQDTIAEAMDGFVNAIDGYAEELDRLRNMKSSLMSDLLSGRVRVPG
ncbi:restriction endonuclease subunit S [Mesorhizobium sp. AA23]|uniref:restriction endonuclease subunit S n=1 Tax=Mesorhizobium sp. AA23 TaxID=1854058 RepID=UPI0007FE2284|nr:restriction endonuclease subunit S [Mesorhizobium sp. AA23]OBQ97485.1 hypothetical protein A9K66_03415 [Mesorhizobium sp. AA23]